MAERAPTARHHPLRRPGAGVLAAGARVQDGPVAASGIDWPGSAPGEQAIARAAEILNAGGKVAILVGQGARGARAEVEQVADLLGAGVAKALLGKDVLSDELPYVTGSIGLLGTRPSYELMWDCDTLLTVGSSFPYTQFLPDFDQARARADRHRRQVHRHALPVRGQPRRRRGRHAAGPDPAAAAQEGPLVARGHRGQRGPLVGGRWTPRRWSTADPVNPMRVFHELSPGCRDDAIVAADSGSAANWYARHLKFRGDMRGSLSGNAGHHGSRRPVRRSARSSATRTGRSSRSSATAPCR